MLDLFFAIFYAFTFLFCFAIGGIVMFGLARYIWHFKSFPVLLILVADPETGDFNDLTINYGKHPTATKTGR